VIVVGGGLIGLTSALAIAESGRTVIVIEARHAGAASPAAAGMLAPSIDAVPGPAFRFAQAARDAYPPYIEWLAERTGVRVALNRRGILEVALSEHHARELRALVGGEATWLDNAQVARMEPALARSAGALHHALDGSVDNVRLLHALDVAVSRTRSIQRVDGTAGELGINARHARIVLRDGSAVEGSRVILAAGAWAPLLRGLPRPLPIVAVRGQMMSLRASPLRHVVFGKHGYAVPRGRLTVIGGTMEHVGFRPTLTTRARTRMHAGASALCPALRTALVLAQWAGLRPITPDMLPIIGPDPDVPRLIYACGHSRNGILMAPLTAACVAALVAGTRSTHDLSPFAADRFTTRR
jgi:glycine oxidase